MCLILATNKAHPCPTLDLCKQLVARLIMSTVKPVFSGHLKIDKTMVLMEYGSLMKIESITECF